MMPRPPAEDAAKPLDAGSGSPGGYWGAPSAEDVLSLDAWWEWYGDDETPPRPVVDVPLPEWP